MALILSDTDQFVDTLRRLELDRSRFLELLRREHVFTSTVTVFQLLSAARSDAEAERIERLLARTIVLPLDDRAARAAAAVESLLVSVGLRIGIPHTMIAGIALANGCAFLTHNVKEFERVPGLELVSLS